jgi:hypothetical protein
MIPLGTHLTPRNPADPEVVIGGIEGSHYTLKATAEFGPTFALSADEIAAAYDCSGYTIFIEPFDEIAAWWKMATAKPKKAERVPRAPEYSPEAIFKAEAARNAKAK